MKHQDVIATLRANEKALRARGVNHVALFGSAARGEADANSDLDILVDVDPLVVRTIYDYAGLREYIAGMFSAPVDVVDRESLKPHVRPTAMSDAIYAF